MKLSDRTHKYHCIIDGNFAFVGMPTAQILNQAAGKQLYSVVGAGRHPNGIYFTLGDVQ